MGLFKKKKEKAPKETGTKPAAIPAPSQPAFSQKQPPPTKEVFKIIGDEKHITTERIDANGQRVMQTQIVKLTPSEKEQFGVPTQHQAPPRQPQEQAPRKPPPQQPNVMRTPDTSNDTKTQVTNVSFGDESLATIEITRELVKKFISDIWNRGEVEMIPLVCHPSLRFNGHVGMDRVGHEGFERMVITVREALTDYHCEIHSMVVESNKAFCRLRFTGKHTGNLLGYAPTGKTVSWMGASEFTCKNGKILKVWELGDVKSLEDQLRDAD